MMEHGKQKIGLFGGTFDPVHDGHLAVARHVLTSCDIDSLLFIPAPYPPHKKAISASFEHRVAMLRLALVSEERMSLSLIEKAYPGPSYTVRTVKEINRQSPHLELFLIIGADSLVDLPHWHRVEELLHMVHLIVAGRGAADTGTITSTLDTLQIPFSNTAQGNTWHLDNGRTVRYLPHVRYPVSSSELRLQLSRGEIPSMLPKTVYHYIQEHNLYQGG